MWQNIKDHFHLGYVYLAIFGLMAATLALPWYWRVFDAAMGVILWFMYQGQWRRARAAAAIAAAKVIRSSFAHLDALGKGYEPVETPTDD